MIPTPDEKMNGENEEIVLLPLNPDYEAIVISDPEEGRFMVVGELVGVVAA